MSACSQEKQHAAQRLQASWCCCSGAVDRNTMMHRKYIANSAHAACAAFSISKLSCKHTTHTHLGTALLSMMMAWCAELPLARPHSAAAAPCCCSSLAAPRSILARGSTAPAATMKPGWAAPVKASTASCSAACAVVLGSALPSRETSSRMLSCTSSGSGSALAGLAGMKPANAAGAATRAGLVFGEGAKVPRMCDEGEGLA